MTLPVFRAAGAVNAYGGNNATLAKPAGTVAGDLLLAFLSTDGPASTAWSTRVPSGWAILQADTITTSIFLAVQCVMYKVAGGSEPSTYPFDFGNQSGMGGVAAWSGVDTTTPINVSALQDNPTSSTSHDIPSITTTAGDCLLIAFYAHRASNGVPYTQPSGMTERFDAKLGTANSNFGVAELALPSAGATGVKTATGNTADSSWTVAIALNPATPAVDTTAPVLSSQTGTATGTTTASGTVTTDEGNGTLYRMASTNATETVATIKAAALTTSVTTSGVQSVTFSGLTAATTYYAHYVQDDAVGNVSNVVNSASFTTSATDTTAPTLSSPTGSATGTTTASGTVSTNEANGTLYALVSTNATETVATVKASGTTQAITTTGVKNVSATGLTAATNYYYHYVHRDAAGNDSTRVTSSIFTTSAVGDTTPPVLSSPTGTQTGSTTASGSASTNEANGALYRYASTNATETAATIKAAALTTPVTATGVQSVTFTGLAPSTLYYAHYVHRDAAGNDSNVVNSSSFTTAAPASATFTYSAPGKNIMGAKRTGVAHHCTVHDKATRALLATKTGLTSDATTGAVSFTLTVGGAIAIDTEYLLMPITDGNDHDTGMLFVTTT